MKVAVIGASNKTHRYSYQAVVLLREKGHEVFPVHQRLKDINGMSVFASVKDIDEDIDVMAMYVSADISNTIGDELIKKNPKRIIFNPGTENSDLENKAKEVGIETINSCTLVMLKSGQF